MCPHEILNLLYYPDEIKVAFLPLAWIIIVAVPRNVFIDTQQVGVIPENAC